MSTRPKNKEPRGFKGSKRKAEKYVKNPGKTKKLLDDAMEKANKNKGTLRNIWDDLMTLFRFVAAWAKGEYKDIPMKIILLAIAAIIYFLMSFDLIPDFIPIAGYFDDATVVAYVINIIREYLDIFVVWEKN